MIGPAYKAKLLAWADARVKYGKDSEEAQEAYEEAEDAYEAQCNRPAQNQGPGALYTRHLSREPVPRVAPYPERPDD